MLRKLCDRKNCGEQAVVALVYAGPVKRYLCTTHWAEREAKPRKFSDAVRFVEYVGNEPVPKGE